jgi:sugar phosphate isomerase/epimerase
MPCNAAFDVASSQKNRAAAWQTGLAFGLVTYQWGKDWDVPTLLKNCQAAGVYGVELRTGHAHRVEPSLSAPQRTEVRKQFADSPVAMVGIGSAEEFHSPDRATLARAIEATKAFVKLSHDVGGTGVKVRPNALPKEVAPEKTIEQIGKSLNVLGAFGADYGQQLRLEIHGGCSQTPIIKKIMDVADHPNVAVCWNSNPTDLQGEGLEANFDLVKARLGATTHVRPLEDAHYPFAKLMDLFVRHDVRGWWLLEAGDAPKGMDLVTALTRQRKMFDRLKRESQKRLAGSQQGSFVA